MAVNGGVSGGRWTCLIRAKTGVAEKISLELVQLVQWIHRPGRPTGQRRRGVSRETLSIL